MSSSPLHNLEWYSTIKAFFTAHPEIPTQPLAEVWDCAWDCDECADSGTESLVDCNHLETISSDHHNMIQVLTWHLGDKKILDVYAYPGDNQAGCIFVDGVAVATNSDESLYPIPGVPQLPVSQMQKFEVLRAAAFGYYMSTDQHLAFEDCEEEGISVPQWMRDLYHRRISLEDVFWVKL